jgi:hypothetical protein
MYTEKRGGRLESSPDGHSSCVDACLCKFTVGELSKRQQGFDGEGRRGLMGEKGPRAENSICPSWLASQLKPIHSRLLEIILWPDRRNSLAFEEILRILGEAVVSEDNSECWPGAHLEARKRNHSGHIHHGCTRTFSRRLGESP